MRNNLQDLIKELEEYQINLSKKAIQTASKHSLGITIDSWGEVTGVDPKLVSYIERTMEGRAWKRELQKLMKEELKKKPTKQLAKEIVRDVIKNQSYIISRVLEEEIKKQITGQLKTAIEKKIKIELIEKELIDA